MSDAYEREQYVPIPPGAAGPPQTAPEIPSIRLIRPPRHEYRLLTLRSRQNNALLNSLSSKVTALRDVTINIHDNARDQDTLDHTVRRPGYSPA
jgi:hypothetical protein